MSSQLIPAEIIPTGLTQAESEYVYLTEVLGMPAIKASRMAGLPAGAHCKAHVIQARDIARKTVRGQLNITREDVIYGIHEAIGRAKILSEPATEIIGWEKIAKIAGLDAPQRIDLNINASIDVLKSHVRGMSDADLANLVDAGNVIDADFYEVPNGEA